jgi:hypothetical protein
MIKAPTNNGVRFRFVEMIVKNLLATNLQAFHLKLSRVRYTCKFAPLPRKGHIEIAFLAG